MKARGRRVGRVLIAAFLASSTAAPAVDAALPCVWADYNLPVVGSGAPQVCSPVAPPPQLNGELTVKRHQPSGPYHVEVGIRMPIPGL